MTPTELDIRVNALQQEMQAQLLAISTRATALACELAACQAKLKDAQEILLRNEWYPSATTCAQ